MPHDCLSFPNHGTVRKGDEKRHFKGQIKRYFREEGMFTEHKAIVEWVLNCGNIVQSPNTIRQWITEARKELEEEEKSPPPPFTKDSRTLKILANKIIPLLTTNVNKEDLQFLLNIIFLSPEIPETFRLPAGDILEAYASEVEAFQALRKSRTKQARKQRQILLSSKVHLNDNGECLNKRHISRLSNNASTKKSIQIRASFEEGGLALFEETLLKKGGYSSRVHSQIINAIDYYFEHETNPDPCHKHSLLVTNANGVKERHPIHYIYGTYNMAFHDFLSKNKDLLKDLSVDPPAFITFYRRMPVWVKGASKITFALCSLCYNFQQKWSAFKAYVLECCACTYDNECMLRQSMGEIKHAGAILDAFLCPKNARKFSFKLACVYGKCTGDECGLKSLETMLESCPYLETNSFEEDELCFKEIKTVKKKISGGKSRQAVVRLDIILKYSTFFEGFKKDVAKYIKHSGQNRHQKKLKKELTKINEADNSIKLPEDYSYTCIDYICNPQVQSFENCQGQFLQPAQISLGVQTGTQCIDGDISSTTNAYFSDDPKHDW